jgi:hypothetical protein
MPSPKSGSAGSAVSPSDPAEAKEADKADPGEVDASQGRGRQTQAGTYGSVKVKPYKPPQTPEEKAKRKSWIEIELVYESNGKPVPGVAFEITLPDGETVASGSLDDNGLARVEGIEPGSSKISFPDLDKEAWEDA